jgi:uncharacterized damage-inducible protein DinB
MIATAVQSMYRYNAWANARLLETAAKLTPEQFLLPRGGNGESVRDTLAHAMAAQWLYLERWNGRSPRAMPEPAEFPDLASLAARWAAIEADTRAFVAALTDARLGEVVAYTNFQGERWAYPLWQQMLHQVNHATQHRSEAAVMLTQFGCSPGWLDLLYFVDVADAAAR